MPACLEVCPVGARKFGNVLDPESEVSQILKHKRVFVLKEDAARCRASSTTSTSAIPAVVSRTDASAAEALEERPEPALEANVKEYLRFLWRCFRLSFVGDWRYMAWMTLLSVIALLGLNAYCKQLVARARHDRDDRSGLLGPLHRELHLPGRRWRPRP